MLGFDMQLEVKSKPPRWSRLGLPVVLGGFLSACVTLPGALNANASGSPGDSVQTAISSGVSALGDFFSPEVREFKKLVTEGKKDEALAFSNDKESYFLERYYEPNTVAPAEFVSLAEHVSATDWAPKLLAARVALNSSLAFDSADARAQGSAAWKASEVAQAAVEKALLYKITPVGRAEVDSLVQARESLKARAIAAKPDVAAGMLETVLTDAAPRYNYVGPLMLERSDFLVSPGFQAAALARLNGAPDRADLVLLARRLGGFLTSDNQAAADQRFVELVRKEFMADGRISLQELAELGNMKTPLGGEQNALKGMVRVGLASLVQRDGTREFGLKTQRDLAFDLDNASDALLKERNGSAYDFVYVLSVANATVRRDGGSAQTESSRYRAGTDREPNPAYARAQQRLRDAESTWRDVRAKAEQAARSPCPPSSRTCLFALAAIQYGVSSAAEELSGARSALSSTPQTLEKPRIASYQYRVVPQTVAKALSAVAVLWDVKGQQAWVMPVERKLQNTFQFVQGVHSEDPDRSSILGRGAKEEELNRFAREPMEMSLGSVFSTTSLNNAKASAAPDANAVLALLSSEYERTAPKDDPPVAGKVFRLN